MHFYKYAYLTLKRYLHFAVDEFFKFTAKKSGQIFHVSRLPFMTQNLTHFVLMGANPSKGVLEEMVPTQTLPILEKNR